MVSRVSITAPLELRLSGVADQKATQSLSLPPYCSNRAMSAESRAHEILAIFRNKSACANTQNGVGARKSTVGAGSSRKEATGD